MLFTVLYLSIPSYPFHVKLPAGCETVLVHKIWVAGAYYVYHVLPGGQLALKREQVTDHLVLVFLGWFFHFGALKYLYLIVHIYSSN